MTLFIARLYAEPVKINQNRLLSDAAKLTGARFRRVLSAEDHMVFPLKPADFAEGLEAGRKLEICLPGREAWTPVTSSAQLRQLLETAWGSGYQVAQALLPPTAGAGRLLSDAGGRIQNLLLQCPGPNFAEDMAPVWNQLAAHTAGETRLIVAVPEGKRGDEARQLLEQSIEHKEKLQFVAVPGGDHWLTQWSRDSILAREDGLLVPNRTNWSSANNNPEGETADTTVAFLLAQAGKTRQASPLPWISLDGGNVVNNARTAFIGEDSLKNTAALLKQHGMEDQALAVLGDVLGKEVMVLPQMTFHVDLSVTPLGEKTVLVADPALGRRLLQALPENQRPDLDQAMVKAAGLREDSILQGYMQELDSAEFEQAATQLQGAGYQVARLPFLPAPVRGQPSLSYNNVLVEEYAGVKQVFLPQYGCPPLDQAARQTYEQLGYSVVPVDMAKLSCQMGALRCSALPIARDTADR
jgi:hypothetical protein